MNSHAYLAKQLFKMAETSTDETVKLSALLRCIEEIAIFRYNIDDSVEDYQSVMLNYIKNDDKIYKLYSEILDEMFYYLLSDEVNLNSVIEDVRKEVNRIQIEET